LISYELQVADAAQGMGIGKKLMNELITLGRAFNMEKILLTVFKGLQSILGRVQSGHHGIDGTTC
jgi:GNAT superfamily N-acetyltransferase